MISVVDHGDGFVVDLPLWLAKDGPTAGIWIDAMKVNRGDGIGSLNLTDNGLALRITGSGNVTLEAHDINWRPPRGPVHFFTQGGYSLSWDSQGRPFMQLLEGDVTVAWSYEAVSMDCSLFINHHATVDEMGWHSMRGSGRSPPPDCTS